VILLLVAAFYLVGAIATAAICIFVQERDVPEKPYWFHLVDTVLSSLLWPLFWIWIGAMVLGGVLADLGSRR
jgi:hypothetical protein